MTERGGFATWGAWLVVLAASCGGPVGDGDAAADDAVAPDDARGDGAGDGGTEDGALDGTADGALDGTVDGALDGTVDGALDASAEDGAFDGSPPDAPVACRADGVEGTCLPVAECTGARASVPGFCPGPTEIQCCIDRTDGGAGDAALDAASCDPAVMPPLEALRDEEPGEGGCPAGMLRVQDSCVDRFEASLAEVAADGTLTPWSPYYNPGARRVRARSVRGAVPQAYVSGAQADAACREAGKRLCTDAEWLRACRGPDDFVYPYGDARMPGVCNDHRAEHPAVEYYGTSASWVYSHLDNACLDQLHDSLDRAGARAGCVTAEGAFDMMGNLHEWTADPAGTFRGGYYVDTVINGDGCLYATTAHDTAYWDYSTGFRCCADP